MVAVSTKYSGVGASRRTSFINRKPASNLHHAVRIAEAISLPLTHFVTLNFACSQCAPKEVSMRFEKMRADRFGPWVRRPPRRAGATATAPTYAWVIEAAGGVIGVHWLVHMPRGRLDDFMARLPAWMADVTGAPIDPGAIDVQPANNPRGAGRYMLKGIDPVWADFYGTEHKAQGIVHGKRSGYSRNLGPTAKRRLRKAGKYRAAKYTPVPIPRPAPLAAYAAPLAG